MLSERSRINDLRFFPFAILRIIPIEKKMKRDKSLGSKLHVYYYLFSIIPIIIITKTIYSFV